MSKDKGRIEGPFTAVLNTTLDSKAWKAMSHGARSLNIAIKRCYNWKIHNNGRLYLSHRKAAEEIGSDTNQITRWFEENQYYGFLRQTKPGCLGVDGKGRAPHWRLTELGYMGDPPTRDFLRWDGVPFSQYKKQNPVRESTDTPSVKSRTPPSVKSRTPIVATVRESTDIETAPTVRESTDISYNHLGRAGGALPEETDKPLSLPLMAVIAGGKTCAQCGGNGEPLFQFKRGNRPVWLHRRCRRYWRRQVHEVAS
jgi:hypothetical protein